MTWVKLDDRFASNPKVLKVSDAALRLYVAGMCHCGLHNLDGKLHRTALAALPAKTAPKLIAELVDAVLWLETGDGWEIKDFLLYNPTREAVEDQRAKRAEAGRKGGQRSGEARRQANASANRSSKNEPRPDPKGLGTESVFTPVGDEDATAGASPPCPRCEDMRWLIDEHDVASPCACTYLKAV